MRFLEPSWLTGTIHKLHKLDEGYEVLLLTSPQRLTLTSDQQEVFAQLSKAKEQNLSVTLLIDPETQHILSLDQP